jgi:glucosamine--fructose-6-phosphate aminotransferase (isomerizing)
VFASETDTEIVAHLIAEAYEQVSGGGHRLHAAVRAALSRLQGAYALCVLSERHPEALVVARNASPLVLGRGQGEQYVASDIPALLEHTRDFIFLDDGDTAVLYEDRAEIFDGANQRVERAVKRISWDPVSAEKQGYKHFMLKEIHEQPARVVDTLRGRLVPEASDVDLLDGINFPEGFPQTLNHVQIVACGTSYHSGLVGRYLLEELARVHTSVDLASSSATRGRSWISTP